MIIPIVAPPLNDIPGGTLPLTVHELAGLWVPNTLKAIVLAVPTVAEAGLTVVALRVVAPASECTAPSEPTTANAAFKTALQGEETNNSPAVTATRTTGVRCNSVIRIASGRLTRKPAERII